MTLEYLSSKEDGNRVMKLAVRNLYSGTNNFLNCQEPRDTCKRYDTDDDSIGAWLIALPITVDIVGRALATMDK